MNRQELDPKAIQEAADVAADYEGLQGLTAALQGAALVFMGVTGSIIWGAVLMAFSVLIGQTYYHRRYGQASQNRRQLGLQLLVGMPCMFLVAAALVADHFWAGPISLGALTGAIALTGFALVSYRHIGPTRLHWVIIGALAASSLVPLVSGIGDAMIWRYSVIVIGLALLADGTLDHVRLTRALDPRLRQAEDVDE